MDPVPLQKNLVDRFKDKTMAVIGYEMDQVDGSRVLKYCDLIIDHYFIRNSYYNIYYNHTIYLGC